MQGILPLPAFHWLTMLSGSTRAESWSWMGYLHLTPRRPALMANRIPDRGLPPPVAGKWQIWAFLSRLLSQTCKASHYLALNIN